MRIVIYFKNAIESLNVRYAYAVKARGHFTSEKQQTNTYTERHDLLTKQIRVELNGERVGGKLSLHSLSPSPTDSRPRKNTNKKCTKHRERDSPIIPA